jgi:hypothetical protein
MPINVVVSRRHDRCPDAARRYGFPMANRILLMVA